MKKNIYLLISVIIQIIMLITFTTFYESFTVLHLVAYQFMPILVSLVLFSFRYFIIKTVSIAVFSLINIVYYIFLLIILKATNAIDTIYSNSLLYTSEYIEISTNDNILWSIVFISAVSVVMHWFAKYLINGVINRNKNYEEN